MRVLLSMTGPARLTAPISPSPHRLVAKTVRAPENLLVVKLDVLINNAGSFQAGLVSLKRWVGDADVVQGAM